LAGQDRESLFAAPTTMLVKLPAALAARVVDARGLRFQAPARARPLTASAAEPTTRAAVAVLLASTAVVGTSFAELHALAMITRIRNDAAPPVAAQIGAAGLARSPATPGFRSFANQTAGARRAPTTAEGAARPAASGAGTTWAPSAVRACHARVRARSGGGAAVSSHRYGSSAVSS
jgi:hypothetical protein